MIELTSDGLQPPFRPRRLAIEVAIICLFWAKPSMLHYYIPQENPQ